MIWETATDLDLIKNEHTSLNSLVTTFQSVRKSLKFSVTELRSRFKFPQARM